MDFIFGKKISSTTFSIFKTFSIIFQTGTCDLAKVVHNFMGEPASLQLQGTFYLRTYSKSPFAIPPAFIGYAEPS
jgi:hypothetical protein